ncbi:hypothetical protein S40293_04847 [Stachybotrys chartarum IBT 40293]|nr:hypothetical protein S40293_04847 [Stachybotrys chartarum IBT 40293]
MAAQVEVDLVMSSDDDDDYVEILPDTHTTPDGLILPSLDDHLRTFYNAAARPPSGRIERRRPRRPINGSQYEQLRRLANPRLYPTEAQPPAQTDVIDLTEEPDSPVETRLPPTPAVAPSAGRNPRRTNSQRMSAPRLARSDSTFMAPPPAANVIDLTDDSPSDDLSMQHPFLHTMEPTRDQLLEFQLDQRRQVANFTRGFNRRLAGIFGTDMFRNAFLTPHLDVTRSAGFPSRPASPKPPMEPIPAAREGFTRGTRAEPEEGDETVVICPACQEELAYDPTGAAAAVGTSGKKKRRAPGEHHFWAVKKCGHVYCADCFENRRPTKNSSGAGFPTLAHGAVTDIRCAVEACDTKVSAKTEWVGIFL